MKKSTRATLAIVLVTCATFTAKAERLRTYQQQQQSQPQTIGVPITPSGNTPTGGVLGSYSKPADINNYVITSIDPSITDLIIQNWSATGTVTVTAALPPSLSSMSLTVQGYGVIGIDVDISALSSLKKLYVNGYGTIGGAVNGYITTPTTTTIYLNEAGGNFYVNGGTIVNNRYGSVTS